MVLIRHEQLDAKRMRKPRDSGPDEPALWVVKTLFAHSGNVCAFFDPDRFPPACEKKLTDPSWNGVNAVICHISGRRPGSARYDATMSNRQRNSFENLLILCPDHSTLIDRLEPMRYGTDRLNEMKQRNLNHAAPPEAWLPTGGLDELALTLHLEMHSVWSTGEEEEPPRILHPDLHAYLIRSIREATDRFLLLTPATSISSITCEVRS
jgi:hypothetical protein